MRTTGESGTAEIASDGTCAGSAMSARTTSVVVPEREIASTASYPRPVGISEATNASLSPAPALSRATATAWAT